MAETHDPRSVTRVVVPLYVEVVPARDDYAMKYVGGAVHEITHATAGPDGERSSDHFSPEDVGASILDWVRRAADPADSMWQVSRIAPLIACTPQQDPPALDQAVIAAARAAVADILETHPQIRHANPIWYHPSTLQLIAAVDALDTPEREAHERYEAAKAAGLSDHEAREDGWPTS